MRRLNRERNALIVNKATAQSIRARISLSLGRYRKVAHNRLLRGLAFRRVSRDASRRFALPGSSGGSQRVGSAMFPLHPHSVWQFGQQPTLRSPPNLTVFPQEHCAHA